MDSFAQRVAEAISNDAHSGSAVWDELNGPSAQLTKYNDDILTITIPQEYDEEDETTGRVCVITVQVGDPRVVKKPKYLVEIWQEDEWWLARVVGVAGGSDISPLNRVTQAESRDGIEDMARDLIATVLDADEDTFDVEVVTSKEDL